MRAGLYRGLTAVCAFTLSLSMGAGTLLEGYRSTIDSNLGTTSEKFVSTSTADEPLYENYKPSSDVLNADGTGNSRALIQKGIDLGRKQEAEGAVLLKNNTSDGRGLPLQSGENVSLFGIRSHTMLLGSGMGTKVMGPCISLEQALSQNKTDFKDTIARSVKMQMGKAGGDDRGISFTPPRSTMPGGWSGDEFDFEGAGLNINPTLVSAYTSLNETYNHAENEVATPDYDPKEPSRSEVEQAAGGDLASSCSQYGDAAIVTISRASAEANDFLPGSVADGTGASDPLELTDNEREAIKMAEECSKNVVVLVNTDTPVQIQELADDPNVSAILWVGHPGAYGTLGIADLLVGRANPSGSLSDTYAVNENSAPSAKNMGDFTYANKDVLTRSAGQFGDTSSKYVIEAEGIYTGYKYYETRYYDATLGQGNATSEAGATAGEGAWNYDDEVTNLSRADWGATWPKTYSDMELKDDELISDLNAHYYDVKTGDDTSSITWGKDSGIKFWDLFDKKFDDEAWDKAMDELSLQEALNIATSGGPSIPGSKALGTYEDYMTENNGIGISLALNASKDKNAPWAIADDDANAGWIGAVLGSAPVVAASFDPDLMGEVGDYVGDEALFLGIPILWGPGLNTHRSAYNGRNGEYYSEDAILTGNAAMEFAIAAEKKGLIASPKHFAFNDQETNRYGIAPYMTEQKAREGDLRAFRIAFEATKYDTDDVDEGMKGVMTSFSKVGPVECTSSYGLITGILKNEWGFHGYCVTDIYDDTDLYGSVLNSGVTCWDTRGISGFDGGTTIESTSIFAKQNDGLTPGIETVKGDAHLQQNVKDAAHNVLFALSKSNLTNRYNSSARRAAAHLVAHRIHRSHRRERCPDRRLCRALRQDRQEELQEGGIGWHPRISPRARSAGSASTSTPRASSSPSPAPSRPCCAPRRAPTTRSPACRSTSSSSSPRSR